jgi:hypothetical protein
VISKVLTAMVLGLVAVLVVFAIGVVTGTRIPVGAWLASGLAAWLGSLVFAAFGLFLGFLVPSENVMQIVGPVLRRRSCSAATPRVCEAAPARRAVPRGPAGGRLVTGRRGSAR